MTSFTPFATFIHKILFSPLEDKFHIFVPSLFLPYLCVCVSLHLVSVQMDAKRRLASVRMVLNAVHSNAVR